MAFVLLADRVREPDTLDAEVDLDDARRRPRRLSLLPLTRPPFSPWALLPTRRVNAMDSMVDWDLAVSLGRRVAGDGPIVTAGEADAAVAELRAAADRSTGLVRDFTGLTAAERTAPVLVVDRPGWVQANADGVRRHARARSSTSSQEKKGAPNGVTRAVGSRVTGARGRAAARLPRVQGARPVRPVPRADRPAAPGRAQHRPRRARARRRPVRLPALGVPARGDPPGAVHRRPVDARPPVRRDRRARRHRRARPGCSTTASSGSPRRIRGGGGSVYRRRSAPPSRRRSSTGSPA